MSETYEEILQNKDYHRRKVLLNSLTIQDLLDLIDNTEELKEWLVEHIINGDLDKSIQEYKMKITINKEEKVEKEIPDGYYRSGNNYMKVFKDCVTTIYICDGDEFWDDPTFSSVMINPMLEQKTLFEAGTSTETEFERAMGKFLKRVYQ